MFIYERSAGPAENEGRYQTSLLKGFWMALTPRIKDYIDWICDPEGAGAVIGFHLPGPNIRRWL